MRIDLKTITWTLALLAAIAVPARPARAQEAEAPRRVTKRIAPVYPAIAQRAHLSGVVRLAVAVAPDGTVKRVKTLGGNAVLATAAEEALRRWTFEAAKKETVETIAVKFDGLP